jgi:hypothetical protein
VQQQALPQPMRVQPWRRLEMQQELVHLKRVALRLVGLRELPQVAKRPAAAHPMFSCNRKRAILPTTMWSPVEAFDDS